MFSRTLILSRYCVSSIKNYGSCAAPICNHHKNKLDIMGHSQNVSASQWTQIKQVETNKLTPQVTYTSDIESSHIPNFCSKIIISDMFDSLKLDIYFPTIGNEVEKIDEISPNAYVEVPQKGTVLEKQAARLIVIRRRKMKKHKLRKLRKRMKFEWAKVRQRREFKKEKLFQAELLAQIKEAEKFDATSYVADRLAQATAVPVKKQRWLDKC